MAAVVQLPLYELEKFVHEPLVGEKETVAGPLDMDHISVVGLPAVTGLGSASNVHEGGTVVGGPT